MSSNSNITQKDGEMSSDALSAWAIAAIIISPLLLLSATLLGAYLLVRRLRDRRRNHGEYRPQLEETLHAKNLPYISPPNIEGLI